MAGKIGTILVVEAIQAILLVGLAVGIFGWEPGPGWSPLAVVAAVALGAGLVGCRDHPPDGADVPPGGAHSRSTRPRPAQLPGGQDDRA
jgi:hypothetical protein